MACDNAINKNPYIIIFGDSVIKKNASNLHI